VQRSLTAVVAAVRRTLVKYEMIRRGDRVLVAVSGGSDSVGLLGILARLQRPLAIDLVCAHVNHCLRAADADADEACAASAADRLGVPFVRAEMPPGLGGRGNLEERAREARYRILHGIGCENGCRVIATGHTEDDQAETVLLRLARGTGLDGLGGIRPVRPDGVIRPLIECSRGFVQGAVRSLGLLWREDLSNRDLRFQRNIVRSRVLPVLRELNPQVSAALARTSILARAQEGLVRMLLDERVCRACKGGRLDLQVIRDVAGPLRGHLVRHWLAMWQIGPRRLTARHIDAVLALAAGSRASGRVELPGGPIIRRRYGWLDVEVQRVVPARPWAARELAIGREVRVPGGWKLAASAMQPATGSPVPHDLWTAACDATAIAGPFTVRRPRRGERVRPFGLGGSRKLSDLFTDRKVPAPERWRYPLVESGGVVVWIPGLVRTDAFLLDAGTRFVVRLTAARESAHPELVEG
jgi:tRNA(Ile)-lysidine synthase